MHLVDHARAYINEKYRRPWADRILRSVLAAILPYPGRFRLALAFAPLGRPFIPLFRKISDLKPLAAMLDLIPRGTARRPLTSIEGNSAPPVASRPCP